jgi:hypothetical protein
LLVAVSECIYIDCRERKKVLRRVHDHPRLPLEADLRLASATSIWAITARTLMDDPIALGGTIKRGSTQAFVLQLVP